MIQTITDLGHTPGLYYALAYGISATVFLSVNPKKMSGWRFFAAAAFFLMILSGFMLLTDGVQGGLFILSMMAIYGFHFLFFRAALKGSWKKALYFSARAFLAGEFAAAFEWQMFYFGLTHIGLPMNWLVNLLFLLVSHCVVFLLIYGMERRFRDSNADMEITGRELIPALLLVCFIFLLSNLSYATPDSPFSSHSDPDIFAIRTLADFGGVGLLFAYHMFLCQFHSRMETEYLNKLLHLQEENYRISAESVELVNRKYHDLKHQLRLLRSEIGADEKLAYLDEMEQEIRSYEAQNKTGNKTLDTLLTAKSLQCQSEDITLTCVADGKTLDFVKPTDLCVLFGNALDNAIESVERIADPEKRLVHISVARQKAFVRIRIENCCEDEIRFSEGLPVTRKDARYHGYGMKSIHSIVDKYDGSMTFKVQNGWFELRILLPIEYPEAPA